MYGHTLRAHDEYLAQNQTIPANAVENGNQGHKRNASGLGSAEILMAVAKTVHLSAEKSFTLSLEDSADGVNFVALPVSFKRTMGSSDQTWEEGEELARMPIPSDCRAYVRVVIGSDDPEVSGAVDVVFSYLPR